MSNDKWTVEDPLEKDDKYEWTFPSDRDQHGEQTTAPGDLIVKPKDLDLVPTLSPKRSGIQHGADDWNYTDIPNQNWYIYGFVED